MVDPCFDVCAVVNEDGGDGGLWVVRRRQVQGCPPIADVTIKVRAAVINVCAAVEKGGGDGGLWVVRRRQVQRGPIEFVSCFDVRATVEEIRDRRGIRIRRRLE